SQPGGATDRAGAEDQNAFAFGSAPESRTPHDQPARLVTGTEERTERCTAAFDSPQRGARSSRNRSSARDGSQPHSAGSDFAETQSGGCARGRYSHSGDSRPDCCNQKRGSRRKTVAQLLRI